MKNFEFDSWDDGRLTVNRDWTGTLGQNGLTTFASLMDLREGAVAKNLLPQRTTTRIELPQTSGAPAAFYIKRHTHTPLKEFIKPLIRLRRPIVGARNEWEAMIRCHAAGIRTMVPVALGEDGGRSFVVTEAIDGCIKLSDWLVARAERRALDPIAPAEEIVEQLAHVARTLHGAGMHHQDFYLGHFLLPRGADGRLFLIDLGRVRWQRRLAARWIVKDLAQLNYSARGVSDEHRRLFVERYFGRPVSAADRRLLRRIEKKTASIARHSARNRL